MEFSEGRIQDPAYNALSEPRGSLLRASGPGRVREIETASAPRPSTARSRASRSMTLAISGSALSSRSRSRVSGVRPKPISS